MYYFELPFTVGRVLVIEPKTAIKLWAENHRQYLCQVELDVDKYSCLLCSSFPLNWTKLDRVGWILYIQCWLNTVFISKTRQQTLVCWLKHRQPLCAFYLLWKDLYLHGRTCSHCLQILTDHKAIPLFWVSLLYPWILLPDKLKKKGTEVLWRWNV